MEYEEKKYGYGKRPLWQWILLYAVIGVVLYALVYYFFFANGSTNYGTQKQAERAPQNNTAPLMGPNPTPAQTSDPNAPSPLAPVGVSINSSAFSPGKISVVAGTKVTWSNNDSVSHTVTSESAPFDSGTLKPGGMFSFTFITPGTYTHHCTIHPSMTG